MSIFFLCLCYILRAIRAGRCRERRYDLILSYIHSDILQNTPFRSQIFQIFFASRGKGALAPLTKILRMFLGLLDDIKPQRNPYVLLIRAYRWRRVDLAYPRRVS